MRLIDEMGQKAKTASRTLAIAGEKKNTALKAIAAALRENVGEIIAANLIDLENGRKNGLSDALIDRLTLNESRIEGMAEGVLEVAALPDPVGAMERSWLRPNGLRVSRMRKRPLLSPMPL